MLHENGCSNVTSAGEGLLNEKWKVESGKWKMVLKQSGARHASPCLCEEGSMFITLSRFRSVRLCSHTATTSPCRIEKGEVIAPSTKVHVF